MLSAGERRFPVFQRILICMGTVYENEVAAFIRGEIKPGGIAVKLGYPATAGTFWNCQ
jgi:hypothetical protein